MFILQRRPGGAVAKSLAVFRASRLGLLQVFHQAPSFLGNVDHDPCILSRTTPWRQYIKLDHDHRAQSTVLA